MYPRRTTRLSSMPCRDRPPGRSMIYPHRTTRRGKMCVSLPQRGRGTTSEAVVDEESRQVQQKGVLLIRQPTSGCHLPRWGRHARSPQGEGIPRWGRLLVRRVQSARQTPIWLCGRFVNRPYYIVTSKSLYSDHARDPPAKRAPCGFRLRPPVSS